MAICVSYCFCIKFDLSSENEEKLGKKLVSKEYKEKFFSDLDKAGVKIRFNLRWMSRKRSAPKELQKRLLGFRLISNEAIDCEELAKALPIIQQRYDELQEYDIENIGTMICTEFGFDVNEFKPVGQLSFPAELPFPAELEKKLGSASLVGFQINFKKSPLGLRCVEISQNDEIISLEIYSNFKSKLYKGLVSGAYEQAYEIAKLFVEKTQS